MYQFDAKLSGIKLCARYVMQQPSVVLFSQLNVNGN